MNLNESTTIPSGVNLQRKWFVIDAAGQTLGRLSSHAASILAGIVFSGAHGLVDLSGDAYSGLKGDEIWVGLAASGSFDCVWRKMPRQTPLRMTSFLPTQKLQIGEYVGTS